MIKRLETEIENLPRYLHDREKWTSLLIDKFPPIIHRLAYKIDENYTLLLHKLFNCEGAQAMMHSHSWDLACKVVEGGYEQGVGFSRDRASCPKATFTTMVQPGDIYEIVDENTWHYTKCSPAVKFSYSILLIGPRKRERKSLNNDPLSKQQCDELFQYFNSLFA